MSFWYDKKGKSYASKGNSSWVKFYAEYLVSTLRGEVENLRNTLTGLISRHFSGVEGKHNAEDIIFDENRSVKDAVSENAENLDKVNEDMSGKSDINHKHDGLYATEAYVAQEITKVNTGGSVDLTPYATKRELAGHNISISAHEELIEKVLDIKYAVAGHKHDTDYVTPAELATKSDINHKHEGVYAVAGHKHDTDYVTPAELATKSDINHKHEGVYAVAGHKHDTDYVTPAELATKSDINHKHDGYASVDLSNVTDPVFKAKADAAGVGGGNAGGGIPVIDITGDGIDYTGRIDGITRLSHGMMIIVTPDTSNFITSGATLDINGYGRCNIVLPTKATERPKDLPQNILCANRPATLIFNANASGLGGGEWLFVDRAVVYPEEFSGKLPVIYGGTGQNNHPQGSYLVGNGQDKIKTKTPAEVLEDICKKPTLTATTPRGVKIGSENWTGTGYFCTDTDVLYQVKDSAVEDGAAYTRFCLRPSDRSLKNYLNWTPHYVNGDTEIEFVWSETRGLYDALILLTDESAQDVIDNRIVWKFHPPVKIKYGRISNAIRKSTIAEGDIRYAMAPKECLRDFSGCFSEKDKEIIEKIYNERVIEPFEGLAPNELSFLYLATDCLGNGEVFTYPTLSEAVNVIAGMKPCLTIETIDNFGD